MKKFLKISEYSKLGKIPNKKDFEHEFNIDNSIFRSSVCIAENKETIKESFYDMLYNNSKIDEVIIPLDKIVIYDDLDVDKTQKLAYTYECPVCLNKIISSDANLNYCPQCENETFPLTVIALLNIDQMEDIAINDKDVSKLIIVKDNEIKFIDEPEC